MKRVLPVLVSIYILSLLGELGSFWWVFDLFSHWRVLYLAAGTLLLLLTFVAKQKMLTFITGAIMVCHIIVLTAFVQVFPISVPVRAASADETLTVVFANTYWKNESMETLISGIQAMEADIIFLEEIQPQQFEEVLAQLPEYTFSYHEPVDFAFDMGVLSRVPVQDYTTHYFLPAVPLLEVVVMVNNQELHLLGVHPHSPVTAKYTAERNVYLERLFEYVHTSDNSIVMGGDFNITQFSPVYRELLRDSRMIDTQKQFKLLSTWPTYVPTWVAIPIDHVFVSPDVIVRERYRGENTGSDHWPIVVKVGL